MSDKKPPNLRIANACFYCKYATLTGCIYDDYYIYCHKYHQRHSEDMTCDDFSKDPIEE